MKPKKKTPQGDLFRTPLTDIINMRHELCQVARRIDWNLLEEKLGAYYDERMGAPGKSTRLMVGLHYLKHSFNHSDESVVARLLENPYWQYFCGFEYFEHSLPLDPSSMTRWRQRIGESGVEELLAELLNTARRSGELGDNDLKRVSVDTTVQEKAITFPTDARLYFKMRQVLVRAAKERGVELRQSYHYIGKSLLVQHSRYAHAKQFKRARRVCRKLRTQMGRVARDIERKLSAPDEKLAHLLSLCWRLYAQQRYDKNKLYSIHAPEVDCISKGKAHKRYEFGCKVGIVVSARSGWVLGIKGFPGAPYDGHTLSACLSQMQRLTNFSPQDVLLDKGYRGHDYKGEGRVHIVSSRKLKRHSYWVRNWMRRRTIVEPVIGHAKLDHRMSRCYLKGSEGDKINALLCGCGFNLRKLLRAFLGPFWAWYSQARITHLAPEAHQTVWSC